MFRPESTGAVWLSEPTADPDRNKNKAVDCENQQNCCSGVAIRLLPHQAEEVRRRDLLFPADPLFAP